MSVNKKETEPRFISWYKNKKEEYVLEIDFDYLKDKYFPVKNKATEAVTESLLNGPKISRQLSDKNISNSKLLSPKVTVQPIIESARPVPTQTVIVNKQEDTEKRAVQKVDVLGLDHRLREGSARIKSVLSNLDFRLSIIGEKLITTAGFISRIRSKLVKPVVWSAAVLGMGLGVMVAVEYATPPLKALTTEPTIQENQTIQAVSLEETTSFPIVTDPASFSFQHRLTIKDTQAILFGQKPVRVSVSGKSYVEAFKALAQNDELRIKAQDQEWYEFGVSESVSVSVSDLEEKVNSYPYATVIFELPVHDGQQVIVVTRVSN